MSRITEPIGLAPDGTVLRRGGPLGLVPAAGARPWPIREPDETPSGGVVHLAPDWPRGGALCGRPSERLLDGDEAVCADCERRMDERRDRDA